jgi:hypothetical protein
MNAKTKKRLEWAGILTAGAALAGTAAYFIYEHETANPLVLAPGVVSGVVPSTGSTTFQLPTGAKGWSTASSAGVSATGATLATTIAVPTAATSGLKLPTPHGSGFSFSWVDANGSTQATQVTFV